MSPARAGRGGLATFSWIPFVLSDGTVVLAAVAVTIPTSRAEWTISKMGLTAGAQIGRHRIESRVARGGMAIVYRATQLGLDRSVAPRGLPRSQVIVSGVPTLRSGQRRAMSEFFIRMQPWEGAPGMSDGSLVPWMPTTPPCGHSLRVE